MSNARRGPDATMVSLPTLTTLPLPLTGEASMSTPRAPALARTSAEASSDTLEQSTMSPGLASPVSSPFSPWITDNRSSEVETMLKTMSRSFSSRGVSANLPPNSARGSALLRVRL